MIPPLSTPRLELQPFSASDAEQLHELWSSAPVRQHLWDGKTISIDQARAVVREAVTDAARTSIGMWTLWFRNDPRLAGFCGFRWMGVARGHVSDGVARLREARPATSASPGSIPDYGTDVAPEPELLYALRSDLWGQGLAVEAAGRCIEWLFQAHPVSRVLAGADPANERSQRVLERLGFVPIDDPPGFEYTRYFALGRTDANRR